MTRILRSVGLALAIAAAGLGVSALSGTAGGATGTQSSGTTPLPPGWELCILQGVDAPATQADVADLDAWQAAEGGSTNNTAAYNPFNTGRTIDASGAAIAGQVSSSGFPAWATWPEGCEATVITLLQPNMWSITAALRAGGVNPPGAFLAVVDQSAWCAPSADGVPCYVNSILGVAGNLPDLLTSSSALDVYGKVRSDLTAYQQAITAVTADQGMLAAWEQQLAAAQSQTADAQGQFDAASRALRRFAIEEYVSSGLYVSSSVADPSSHVTPLGPQDADGVVAQQYLSIAASNLLARVKAADAAIRASRAGRTDAARSVTQAALKLASDNTAERRSLTQMVTDVATLQNAGACTSVTITASAPAASPAGPGATVATTIPSTVPTTVPATTAPTTTTTTAPAATTTTSTSTTSTTTTVPGSTPASTAPTTSTTTSTSTTTTTTTTLPPTSTTTTTVPGATSTASPPKANPAGVAALQGCVAALAPSTSA